MKRASDCGAPALGMAGRGPAGGRVGRCPGTPCSFGLRCAGATKTQVNGVDDGGITEGAPTDGRRAARVRRRAGGLVRFKVPGTSGVTQAFASDKPAPSSAGSSLAVADKHCWQLPSWLAWLLAIPCHLPAAAQ